MTDESERERYREAWDRMRKRRRVVWLSVVVCIVVGIAAAAFQTRANRGLFAWLGAVALCMYALSYTLLDLSRCPRCGRTYRWWRLWVRFGQMRPIRFLPKKCSYCRLPFGAEPGEHADDK